jgi:NTE family protein
MDARVQPHTSVAERRLPFECVALVLQGGGALGAYQAGAYEALAEAGIHPVCVPKTLNSGVLVVKPAKEGV